MLKTMYITKDPDIAQVVLESGVDRIFVDMETLGKMDRQGHVDSVKSNHNLRDVAQLHQVVKHVGKSGQELLVRINPIHDKTMAGPENENPESFSTEYEVECTLENGADCIMLPMWKTAEDAARFVRAVDGRARTVLLLENKEAAENLPQALKISGIDEIHIGLNDLHLSYGLKFMFQLVANGTVERLGKQILDAGIPYGFGGVACLGTGMLPAELILADHYRLHSSMVILSRGFCAPAEFDSGEAFAVEMSKRVAALRQFEQELQEKDDVYFQSAHRQLCECVNRIVGN